MSEINIKHFDKHRKRLIALANSLGIKIKYNDSQGDGAYQQSRSSIVIDPDLEQSTELATMLHELGHVIDFSRLSYDESSKADVAYYRFYRENRKAFVCDQREVLKWERRAWKTGRGIAKLLKIPLGKWFDFEEHTAIKTYESVDE